MHGPEDASAALPDVVGSFSAGQGAMDNPLPPFEPLLLSKDWLDLGFDTPLPLVVSESASPYELVRTFLEEHIPIIESRLSADPLLRDLLVRTGEKVQSMVAHHGDGESDEHRPTCKREREPTVDEETAERCPHGSNHDKVIVPTQRGSHTYSLRGEAVATKFHGETVLINVCAASSPSGLWMFDCNQCRCLGKFEVCKDGKRFDAANPKDALEKAGILIDSTAAWARCKKLRVDQ